jgi:hypothetical protein
MMGVQVYRQESDAPLPTGEALHESAHHGHVAHGISG